MFTKDFVLDFAEYYSSLEYRRDINIEFLYFLRINKKYDSKNM